MVDGKCAVGNRCCWFWCIYFTHTIKSFKILRYFCGSIFLIMFRTKYANYIFFLFRLIMVRETHYSFQLKSGKILAYSRWKVKESFYGKAYEPHKTHVAAIIQHKKWIDILKKKTCPGVQYHCTIVGLEFGIRARIAYSKCQSKIIWNWE